MIKNCVLSIISGRHGLRTVACAAALLVSLTPAFAQLEDISSSVVVPEKVYTLTFGYATVYYDAMDGYFLKMHTDSRKDSRDTYNVIMLGKTAGAALVTVDRMSEILAGDKLYTEARQKGTVIRFTREVNAVGFRQLAIRQEMNRGDSRLNEKQLARLRSFLTQKAAEEEAERMRLRRLREEEEGKVKEEGDGVMVPGTVEGGGGEGKDGTGRTGHQ